MQGRVVQAAGVRTHLYDEGTGPVVLLLHGGAWGECAETTWPSTITALVAAGYRAVAPDWLGFGESDKVRDFADTPGRMLQVLRAALDEIGVTDLHAAVGLSMGGSHLLRALTAEQPLLRPARVALLAAGGAPIPRETWARLMQYDGTTEAMREQVRLAVADPSWVDHEDPQAQAYVALRHQSSLRPGAYEWFASLGLRSPAASPPPADDPTPYERVEVPVLLVEGACDPLKPAGWAQQLAPRFSLAQVAVLPGVGHLAPVEDPAGFIDLLLEFLGAPADVAGQPSPSSTLPTPAPEERA